MSLMVIDLKAWRKDWRTNPISYIDWKTKRTSLDRTPGKIYWRCWFYGREYHGGPGPDIEYKLIPLHPLLPLPKFSAEEHKELIYRRIRDARRNAYMRFVEEHYPGDLILQAPMFKDWHVTKYGTNPDT